MEQTCQGKTAAGKSCKRPATKGSYCYQHGPTSSTAPTPAKAKAKTPAKAKAVRRRISPESVSPKKKASKPSPRSKEVSLTTARDVDEAIRSMEAEWRSDRMSPGMGSLGWSPTKAKLYTKEAAMERIMKYYPEELGDRIPFPAAFTLVANKLEKICQSIPFGSCQIHPTMPGMQWDNHNSNTYEATKEKWQKSMWKKGNHYFHSVETSENSHYPSYDREYCMCHEWKTEDNAVATLALSLSGNDEEWGKYHGFTASDSAENGPPRVISLDLRKKILKDTIDFLGQEYKIHLQPRPEYQLPVIRVLVKLISTDPVFASHIEAWKTIIPYNRVTVGLNLPVVVIYPCKGQESATFVLKKIIEVFSKFDAAKIGLNHTPRFNHKVNELIYYANGSGDHKKLLPEKFFTGPGKEFYKGHELYL